jgi:hypothetical protein
LSVRECGGLELFSQLAIEHFPKPGDFSFSVMCILLRAQTWPADGGYSGFPKIDFKFGFQFNLAEFLPKWNGTIRIGRNDLLVSPAPH